VTLSDFLPDVRVVENVITILPCTNRIMVTSLALQPSHTFFSMCCCSKFNGDNVL